MKINVFNKINSVKNDKTMKPIISFNKSGGTVRLNRTLAEMLNNRPVSFMQDQENEFDWFIFIDEENGFKTGAKNNDGGVVFRSEHFSRIFKKSLRVEQEASYRLQVSRQETEINGVKCFAILTGSLKNISEINRKH